MKHFVVPLIAAILMVLACEDTTDPGTRSTSEWSYRAAIDGDTLTGTLALHHPGPTPYFTGRFEVEGDSGKITGARVEGERQFVLYGLSGDTLRHTAPARDTMRGTWERGRVVGGSWEGAGESGSFTAARR